MYMNFTIAYPKDWKGMWTDNHSRLIRVMGLWDCGWHGFFFFCRFGYFSCNLINTTFKTLEIIYHVEWHNYWLLLLLLFSHSVVSDSLWPHGWQHARLPRPSPSPRAWSNSCLLSWWCHPTISSSVIPFSSCLQSLAASGSFLMRWSKYWIFKISPSNDYSGLISFGIDWFDLLAVQGNLKSLLQHHSSIS